MNKFLYIIFFCVIIVSCKKKTDDGSGIDTTYNYFPTAVGHTWIYDVDSFAYNDNSGATTIDTFYYQYKETITENITDDEGKPAQKLARYYRKNDLDTNWVSANNWVISRDNLRAQKVQENVRYVKLVFPLRVNSSWDGNIYNHKGQEFYSLDYFDQPSMINGISYDKTLQVLQVLDINAIEEIKRYEIYARNVGMIYFQSDSINTQPTDTIGHTKSRGLRYRLRLKSFQ